MIPASARSGPSCIIPGTFRGPWVLPRLEDRGQPPFLHQFEAGNVAGSREGSRISPLEPHAGLQGLHSHSAAFKHRLRPVHGVGRRRGASAPDHDHCYQPLASSRDAGGHLDTPMLVPLLNFLHHDIPSFRYILCFLSTFLCLFN